MLTGSAADSDAWTAVVYVIVRHGVGRVSCKWLVTTAGRICLLFATSLYHERHCYHCSQSLLSGFTVLLMVFKACFETFFFWSSSSSSLLSSWQPSSVQTDAWSVSCEAAFQSRRGFRRCRLPSLGAVIQLVQYRTRNWEVAGSTHTRSTASNLEQVANLLCAQANPASYPQRDGKWIVATATGWRPSVADSGDGVSASCTVSPIVC